MSLPGLIRSQAMMGCGLLFVRSSWFTKLVLNSRTVGGCAAILLFSRITSVPLTSKKIQRKLACKRPRDENVYVREERGGCDASEGEPFTRQTMLSSSTTRGLLAGAARRTDDTLHKALSKRTCSSPPFVRRVNGEPHATISGRNKTISASERNRQLIASTPAALGWQLLISGLEWVHRCIWDFEWRWSSKWWGIVTD